MDARAKFLGHPIHQMLVPLPFGMFAVAPLFDLASIITGRGLWSGIAFWMIAAGIVLGLLAKVFGLIDSTVIPRGTRAKRVAALHGGGNVVVVVLFLASWLLRRDDPSAPGTVAYLLSFAAFGLAGVTGWLGGSWSVVSALASTTELIRTPPAR